MTDPATSPAAAPPHAGARLAYWLPSSFALVLLAWLWSFRVGGLGAGPAPADALWGFGVDLLVTAGLFAHHRAAATTLRRISVAAALGAIGMLRGLGALCAVSLDRPVDAAFAAALWQEPEWMLGARWLLLLGLTTAPLTAACLLRDRAAWVHGVLVAADPAAAASNQGTVAAVAFVLAAVVALLIGAGPGAGAEVVLLLAWSSP